MTLYNISNTLYSTPYKLNTPQFCVGRIPEREKENY